MLNENNIFWGENVGLGKLEQSENMEQKLIKLKYMNLKKYSRIIIIKEWTNKYLWIKLKLKLSKKNKIFDDP